MGVIQLALQHGCKGLSPEGFAKNCKASVAAEVLQQHLDDDLMGCCKLDACLTPGRCFGRSLGGNLSWIGAEQVKVGLCQ